MRNTAMKALVAVVIAVLAAMVMTLLSAVPPLSYLRDWAEGNNMMYVWYGVIAGV